MRPLRTALSSLFVVPFLLLAPDAEAGPFGGGFHGSGMGNHMGSHMAGQAGGFHSTGTGTGMHAGTHGATRTVKKQAKTQRDGGHVAQHDTGRASRDTGDSHSNNKQSITKAQHKQADGYMPAATKKRRANSSYDANAKTWTKGADVTSTSGSIASKKAPNDSKASKKAPRPVTPVTQ